MKIVELTYRYDGTEATARPRPDDADAARARLDDGSRSIAALLATLADGTGVAQRVIHVDPEDLGVAGGGRRAPPQRPFAAVLGCSDARVPIELVFNEGPNDLFVVRVAGNGLGAEVLGSLKYAVDHLGESLKLVVVLGHSGCGAVTAAVDVYLKPGEYLALAAKHALRSILDRLLVVINAAAKRMAEVHGPDATRRPGYRTALIEAASVSHAAVLGAYTLQQELGGSAPGQLRAAYGVYLLDARTVWAPRSGSAECSGLAYPPADLAAFAGFADAVVRSGADRRAAGPQRGIGRSPVRASARQRANLRRPALERQRDVHDAILAARAHRQAGTPEHGLHRLVFGKDFGLERRDAALARDRREMAQHAAGDAGVRGSPLTNERHLRPCAGHRAVPATM